MTDPLVSVPPANATPHTEQIVLPVQQATLAGVEEMLDRQRDEFLRQSRDVLVEAINRVVMERGSPLAEQLRTTLVQTLEEVRRQQMGPFFEKTRETILATFKDVTQEHLRPLVEQLRETLLQTAEEMQKRQLDPLLARVREFLLTMADKLWDKYTAPLAEQVKQVLLDTVEKMREQHAQPFLAMVNRMRDALVSSLITTLTQPVEKFVNEQLTHYTDWAGRRILNFTLAATFLSVGVILVVLGTGRALEALRVPSWCALLVVGLAAILFGLFFYLRWNKLGRQPGVKGFQQPPKT